jgi:hypothetical protein
VGLGSGIRSATELPAVGYRSQRGFFLGAPFGGNVARPIPYITDGTSNTSLLSEVIFGIGLQELDQRAGLGGSLVGPGGRSRQAPTAIDANDRDASPAIVNEAGPGDECASEPIVAAPR